MSFTKSKVSSLLTPIPLPNTRPLIFNSVIYSPQLQPLNIGIADFDFDACQSATADLSTIKALDNIWHCVENMGDGTFKLKNCYIQALEYLVPFDGTVMFVYQNGIVFRNRKSSFSDFLGEKDIIDIQEQFDHMFEIGNYKKSAILFSNECNLIKNIQKSTHWLQMDKVGFQILFIDNKLQIFGKEINTGQIKYEDAQFMTKIDEYYYFYSKNICYKTDESFFIIEQKDIQFPFYVRQKYSNFEKFDNDYPQWFVSCECNGRHFSNVYDMLYEFKPFQAIQLTAIPDYPIDQKQNHKVTSVAGQLFVTNGRDIFVYNLNANSFKIVNICEDCIMLRLHTINGQILVRDNQNRKLYTLGLNHEFIKIEDNFKNTDLILANSNYLLNYSDKFCITYNVNQTLTHIKSTIRPIGEDIKRINYILNNGEWDVTDQTLFKILDIEKEQIQASYQQFEYPEIPQTIEQIVKDNHLNLSFVQYCYFVLSKQLRFAKHLHSGIVQLMVITQQQDHLQYLVEYCDVKLQYNDFVKIFQYNDIDKFLKIVEASVENANCIFETIEDDESELKIIQNTQLNRFYICFCIQIHKNSTQIQQHLKQCSQVDVDLFMNQAIKFNNVEIVNILKENATAISSHNILNFSPEVASALSFNNDQKVVKDMGIQQYFSVIPDLNIVPQADVFLCDYITLTQKNIQCNLATLPSLIYIKEKLKTQAFNRKVKLPAHLKKEQLKYKNSTVEIEEKQMPGGLYNDDNSAYEEDYDSFNDYYYDNDDYHDDDYDDDSDGDNDDGDYNDYDMHDDPWHDDHWDYDGDGDEDDDDYF
ncbi:Conserved_hypothetical protein [Hexamita inflata]|uniref:Uncharacterized protein n=1 Tax=Hexamita inflata TaxID=28002 RepID=A0AA86NJB6_9EUKA|nr:Conserved hypothetical protein [Hexamita inflata]